MTVLLAMASALAFGAADFTGGLAARRAPVLMVTLLSQGAGAVLLVPAVLLLDGRFSTAALVTGALAGLGGGAGLLLYLRALAIGPMGVASPLAGAVGAALPVGVALLLGEHLSPFAVAGAVLGLAAVVLASAGGGASLRRALPSVQGPMLALVSGLLFGLFFVALDASPSDSGLWPIVGARLSSLVLLGGLLAVRRRPLPGRSALPLIAASGILDMLANVLFLSATRAGLLAIAALLASLYPVVVAVLARGVLGERMTQRQQVGVALCVTAIALISVG